MLELKEIYKTFNRGTITEKKAINGVDLKLNEGDFVTVDVGNGCAEIKNEACQGSRLQKLICGTNCHTLWQRTFSNCANLLEVDLSRTAPLKFEGMSTFSTCQRLKTVK